MNLRKVASSDEPKLREFHKRNGFEHPFPKLEGPHVIGAYTICDDADGVIGTIVATQTVELTLLLDPDRHPALKLAAIRKLHSLLTILTEQGYHEANAFIPPEIARSYGRRLASLGWLKSWANWCIRF